MKNTLKKALLSPWTALLTLALVLSIRITDPVFVESIRLRYFDTLITSKAPTQNNIITRSEYAKIIEGLYDRGAGLVVFNVLMPESDRLGGDAALAETLKKYPVVLANMPGNKEKNTPRAPGSAVLGPEYLDQIINYPGVIANIPRLEQAAAGIGGVQTLPEVDGVNRRIPLVFASQDQLYACGSRRHHVPS